MADERKQPPTSEIQPPRSEEEPGRRFIKGEHPIMADGQLGGEALDQGPERRNPEGTVDIPNPPADEK